MGENRWGYVSEPRLTWTQVKKMIRKYVDFANPITRKFDGVEYLCVGEWATNRRPRSIASLRSNAMNAGLYVRIVKGVRSNKHLSLLRGHATEAMYVRPKNLKDQNALEHIGEM